MIVMMMMNMLELMRLGLGASLAAVPRTEQARYAHVVFHRAWSFGRAQRWEGGNRLWALASWRSGGREGEGEGRRGRGRLNATPHCVLIEIHRNRLELGLFDDHRRVVSWLLLRIGRGIMKSSLGGSMNCV